MIELPDGIYSFAKGETIYLDLLFFTGIGITPTKDMDFKEIEQITSILNKKFYSHKIEDLVKLGCDVQFIFYPLDIILFNITVKKYKSKIT